jgi:hypothetical protein
MTEINKPIYNSTTNTWQWNKSDVDNIIDIANAQNAICDCLLVSSSTISLTANVDERIIGTFTESAVTNKYSVDVDGVITYNGETSISFFRGYSSVSLGNVVETARVEYKLYRKRSGEAEFAELLGFATPIDFTNQNKSNTLSIGVNIEIAQGDQFVIYARCDQNTNLTVDSLIYGFNGQTK